MMKDQSLMMCVENIGEDVGLELGNKFVTDFQTAFPNEAPGFLIGGKILNNILAQPGCEGIKVYNAINEFGQKTLVYVGVDKSGRNILEVTTIGNQGTLQKDKAIVGDRTTVPTRPSGPVKPGGISGDDWEWIID